MTQRAQVITACDISNLEKEIIVDGKLVAKPKNFYDQIEENTLNFFMLQYGVYVLPTTELIDWLKENIVGSAIEIGAGNGTIARELKIPITDSRLQEEPEIQLLYRLQNQPVIKYPDDVEKLEAQEAIDKYKPDTVIGAFITHKYIEGMTQGNMYGVEEELVLGKTKKYIMIGNKTTHKSKPVLNLPHDEFYFDWLITRSANQSENTIFVFKGEKNAG